MSVLKIGDSVWVRGGFGSEPRTLAIVEQIEITNGGKYGDAVDEVPWSEVYDRNVTVDLDNGHWAYAHQLKKYGNTNERIKEYLKTELQT